METINQLYSALNASNNLFESNIQALYKKEETSNNNQRNNELLSNINYISTLRKINEIRNAIISNKNLGNRSTINSITIPSASSDINMVQNEQNSKIDFSIDNMVQNQFNNLNILADKYEVSKLNISNNINLFNQNSIYNTKNYNSQIPSSINVMNNYGTSSNTNLLNGLNCYSNVNTNSIISPVQMNDLTTLPLNQTSLFMNTTPSTLPLNNFLLLSKDKIKLLYLAKLIKAKQNQLMVNKERKSKFNSMIIPSNESIMDNNLTNNSLTIPLTDLMETNETNNLANNSITIPSTEIIENNNNSMIIPMSEPNENTINDNNFINSLNIPFTCEDNSNDQLSDNLLKQFQLQQQQLASRINESSSSRDDENEISNNDKFENTLLEIPSITLNNDNVDIWKSSEIISQESDNNIEALMKLNVKQNVISDYTPLSPEQSPILKSDNINSSSNQILKNCIKKNEFNAFSSTDTLNDILSITPEMETINSPVIENRTDRVENGNTFNEFNMNDFFGPLKTIESIDSEDKEKSDNLLTVDNDFLDAPATPKSIANSSSPNNIDLMDFPNIIPNSFEFDSEFNSNDNNEQKNIDINIKDDICNIEQQKQCSIEGKDKTDNVFEGLDLIEKIQSKSSIVEPATLPKRPRGRPRKKRAEEQKSPEEKIEQLSKTIDELLSSDLYAKLYSEECYDSIINQKDYPKKLSSDKDFKFVKQVNTLNYILVSYKRMCNALNKNNESESKVTSEATENQYDIPQEKMKGEQEMEMEKGNEKYESKSNNEFEEKIDDKKEYENKFESNKVEMDSMDSISEEETSESENEEKSLSLLKKEIQQLNFNNNDKSDSNKDDIEEEDKSEDDKEEIIPIRSIETAKNGRKRKQCSDDENEPCSNDQDKRKVVRLSIEQIKNSLENGNRMSIGNQLGVNSVSALTKNGLVLVGRKRIIAENTNRPYVCSTCGAGFVRKHDLNRHEKVHTGVKNYKCPYCDRAFSRNDALSRHLRVELKHRSQVKEKKRGRKGGKKKAANKEN